MTFKEEMMTSVRGIVDAGLYWNTEEMGRTLKSGFKKDAAIKSIVDILNEKSSNWKYKSRRISALLGGYNDSSIDNLCKRKVAYDSAILKASDKRDDTTKALDAMYGKGGWDERDREDYEG